MHVASENAVFDQHRALGRRALVIHVERASPPGDGAVVHHRAELGGHALADAPGEGRGLAAVEVRLQPVSDGLVKQDAGPAGTEDHVHGARGSRHRLEVHQSLSDRLPGMGFALLRIGAVVQRHAPAPSEVAGLTLAVGFDDAADVAAHQRLKVPQHPTLRGGNEDDLVLQRQRGEHPLHPGIGLSGKPVQVLQQTDLALQGHLRKGAGHRIEVVPRGGGDGNTRR